MFAWKSIAHMVLPLGRSGVREIPNETALLGAMHSTLDDTSGWYFFPSLATNLSYWNWYGFPIDYTAVHMTVEVAGFLCVGLVAAWQIKS